MKRDRIAVLGGGMLGVCTSLELARRGHRVTLIEGAAELLQGASRWNEGKAHLGFMYAGDATLNTAARLIPGGLAFTKIVERLVGLDIRQFSTPEDDVFLIHRDSVADAESFAAYASRTADLVRDAASKAGDHCYLTDVSQATVRSMSASELADITESCEVTAGFRIPERSVSTIPVADLLVRAVNDEPRIAVHLNTWVKGVRKRDSGRLDIVTGVNSKDFAAFDVVVNALWEGRLAVDATIGVMPTAPWSHRFRAGVFGHAPNSPLRSALLCIGPFGDVKRYADGRVYLSWYPTGLLAVGHEIEPPRALAELTPERRAVVAAGTIQGLSHYFPDVAALEESANGLVVRGGWVYAIGQGSLADPSSTLHQRDKFSMTVDGGYISVDTAKYSLAPWLATHVAEMIDCA